MEDKTFTVCGTPEYIAGEIISGRGHGLPVDYWSLGVLLFEMLSGQPPFRGDTNYKLFEVPILSCRVSWVCVMVPSCIVSYLFPSSLLVSFTS